MASPLFHYQLGPFDLFVFGQEPHSSKNPTQSYTRALTVGAREGKITRLITASDASCAGFQEVLPAQYDQILSSDGVVLEEQGCAGIIQTADCPAVLLYDQATGRGALVHMGRPALTPAANCQTFDCTVIENAISALAGDESRTSIEVLVTGNICGQCFKHDFEKARPLVEPFRKLPPHVFANSELGALDLYEVIKHRFMYHGVLETNIRHEGPCTLETPTLSSHRRGDLSRNTFIAVKVR